MNNSCQFKPAFLGKVTASVAHELQNVLAIIKETSGLMEDIVSLHLGAVPPELNEKLSTCISSVMKQIDRGVEITSNLNGFAHTTDSLSESVGMLEVIERVVFLTKRLFLHEGLEVEITDSDPSISILTEPVLLQALVYKCIRYSGLFCSGGIVHLAVKNNVAVNIQIKRPPDYVVKSLNKDELLSMVNQVAEQLNAEIKILDGDAGISIGL